MRARTRTQTHTHPEETIKERAVKLKRVIKGTVDKGG